MKRFSFKRFAATATVVVLLPGCLPAVRFRPCPPDSSIISSCDSCEPGSDTSSHRSPESPIQKGPLPVTAMSPFVRIVGESAPASAYAELELLSAELHSALSLRGGVCLEDSALVAELPSDRCGTRGPESGFCNPVSRQNPQQSNPNTVKSTARKRESQNQSPIRRVSSQVYEYFNAPLESDSEIPATGLPIPSGSPQDAMASTPQPLAMSQGGQYEVSVIVNDFTPYRPMQLAATISIRDLANGQELQRFQRVWRSAVHEPCFEETRKERNRDLRHAATRERLEHTALPDISPRHLVKRAATEIADSLHQSVLSSRSFNGQYLSAPQGFHPQP